MKCLNVVRYERKYWLGIHQQGAMGLSYQGKNVTPKFVVDLFIKGEYFHIEGEEREFLKGLPDTFDKLFKRTGKHFAKTAD